MNKRVILRYFLLGALSGPLLIAGCLQGPFADHRVHRTPFDRGWETVHLEDVGVTIELPAKPEKGFPVYEIRSTLPNSTDINMHPVLMRSIPEWASMLSLYIYREKENAYRENTQSNNNRVDACGTLWEATNLFDKMQRQHVLIKKGVPPQPDVYRWDFLKCYKAPNGDVIIVSCVYAMDDEEDFKAIERMIDSVCPCY
ncbi:hypothetical protein JW916_11910 [Candidatus Sumerlaeota bacterium]|nr:hypothetical protein [Candidatus Sumerlaeota bacterium]